MAYKPFIIGILVFLNILAFRQISSQDNLLLVDFLNVGQGDSIFILTPDKKQILIDGGPGDKVISSLQGMMPFYDRTLDLVILTHPEKDHLGGLIDVLKRYKVENIVWTGFPKDTDECREWQKLISNRNVKTLKAGDTIIAGKAIFEILNPVSEESPNNSSLVAKLTLGGTSFLFTGDIDQEKEALLTDVDSDVLKVSHHGSKYSSSEEFLKNVSPEVAVICVGQNSYGHPTEEVLARLDNFGIHTLRTDQSNHIIITSDGKHLKIKTN